MEHNRVVLEWMRFSSLVAARDVVGTSACIYVQADQHGCPVRVGMASKGLHARYRGGTGWALEAAMHQSGNLVFVAIVPAELCQATEENLIWSWRRTLPYNNHGKRLAPSLLLEIEHRGQVPLFAEAGRHLPAT